MGLPETPKPAATEIMRNVNAAKTDVEAALNHLSNETSDFLKSREADVRSAITAVRNRSDMVGTATADALERLQKKLENNEKLVDLSEAATSAGEVPYVGPLASGAVKLTETATNAAGDVIGDAKKDFENGNYASGTIKGVGVGAAIAGIGYLGYKFLKGIFSAAKDGVETAADWVGRNWKVLATLGLAGGGLYLYGKKDEAKSTEPEKPAEVPAGSEDVLEKVQKVTLSNGTTIDVIIGKDSTFTMGGKKLNITFGSLGLISPQISLATLDPQKNLTVEGTAMGMKGRLTIAADEWKRALSEVKGEKGSLKVKATDAKNKTDTYTVNYQKA